MVNNNKYNNLELKTAPVELNKISKNKKYILISDECFPNQSMVGIAQAVCNKEGIKLDVKWKTIIDGIEDSCDFELLPDTNEFLFECTTENMEILNKIN